MSLWRDGWPKVRWHLSRYVPILLGAGLVLGFLLSLAWLWKGTQ